MKAIQLGLTTLLAVVLAVFTHGASAADRDDAGLAASVAKPSLFAANTAPAIISPKPIWTRAGSPFSYTVNATGVPLPTLNVSGNPSWMSLSGFVLSGTPTAADAGPGATITLTASNGTLPNATQTFTLEVRLAPAITSTPPASATIGSLYTYTLASTGYPAPTYTITGKPTWLTLANGVLSGTPPATTPPGLTPIITISASNGVTPVAAQSFSIGVNGAPKITSTPPATATSGTLYTHTIISTGYPVPTYTLSGAPSWMSVTGSVISGTPAAANAGVSGTITLTAANGTAPNATKTFTVTVKSRPIITSTAVTTATAGTPYTYTIASTGYPAPTYTVTGKPTWLTLAGGVLSGTPTAANVGTSGTITILASNGATPNASQAFTITVAGTAPAITSTAVTTAAVGSLYSYTIATSGSAPITLTITGKPTWLTLTGNLLKGTPVAANAGLTPSITITAANGILPTATQTFTIAVSGAPAITSVATTAATAGTQYSYTIAAAGYPAPTLAVAGNPSWLSLAGNVLSGTPAAANAGITPTITITASNGTTPNATQSFTITVKAPPAITSTAATTATAGLLYTYTLASTGYPARTYTVANKPTWLTLTATALSGTPPATAAGPTPTITVTASSGTLPNATQSFVITVSAPPTITAAPTATATAGTAYSYTILSTGFPAPTFTLTGNPSWLSVAGNVLSGNPTAADAGVSGTITLTAANGLSPNASKTFTVTVKAAPAFTSTAVTNATAGSLYSYTLAASGYPAPTYTVTGKPTWLTLTAGVLSGTPPASAAGTTGTITLTASNGTLPNATQAFTITIGASAPAFTSTPVTTAKVGTLYTYAITTSGSAPIVLSTTGKPAWLTLTGSVLSGTPTATDGGPSAMITITASNGLLPNATQSFSIAVSKAPAFTSSAVTSVMAGSLYSYAITASGYPAPTFSIANKPSWLTLTGATLSGTPTSANAGISPTITLTASNGVTPSATQSFTVTVRSAPTLTSTPVTNATAGQPYTYTIVASGYPAMTYAVLGQPSWLTLVGNVLSGTPPASTPMGVTSQITVTVSNGLTPNASQTFVINIIGPLAPTITSSPPNAATVFQYFSAAVFATGYPAPGAANTTLSGMPPWMSFNGTIFSGTPGPFDVGPTGTITITVDNGVAPAATQSFVITVSPAEYSDQHPEILYTYPPANASGTAAIAPNSKIVVVFSEAMNANSFAMGLGATGAGAFCSGASLGALSVRSASSATATGIPGQFNTMMVVTPAAAVTGGDSVLFFMWNDRAGTGNGFRDQDGNRLIQYHNDRYYTGFSGDSGLGFVWTASAPTDSTAPVRSSSVPAAASTGNAPATGISITFNEALNPAQVAGCVNVTDGLGSVSGSTSIDRATLRTITFTPARNLSGTVSVTLPTVQDLCGNNVGTAAAFTFGITSDTQTPVISMVTLNGLPSHLNGAAASGGGSPGGGTLQVPTSGFSIDVKYSDAGGTGVAQNNTIFQITANVAVGGNAAGTNLAPLFPTGYWFASAERAHFVVPSSLAFPVGSATITVKVRDVYGNLSLPSTFTFTAKTSSSSIIPLSGSPDVWNLYFDRDHETTVYDFPNNSVTSPMDDLVTPDTTADFMQDLEGYGFSDTAFSTALVDSSLNSLPPNVFTLDMQTCVRNWIINRILFHLNRHYLMYVPTSDGHFNPSFYSILSTSSPLTSTDTPNIRFVYSATVPSGTESRIAFGGVSDASTLGRAFFNTRNSSRTEDNGVTTANPSLGLFTLIDLKNTYAGTYPSYASHMFYAYDETSPFAGATTGNVIGEDLVNDAFIVDPNKYPPSFTGARLDRYQRVLRGLDFFAQKWAMICAHEVGHSVGLIDDGAPPNGLYGNSSAFAGSTSGHVKLTSYYLGAGTNIMAPSATSQNGLSRFSALEELSVAYLLGRCIIDPP